MKLMDGYLLVVTEYKREIQGVLPQNPNMCHVILICQAIRHTQFLPDFLHPASINFGFQQDYAINIVGSDEVLNTTNRDIISNTSNIPNNETYVKYLPHLRR